MQMVNRDRHDIAFEILKKAKAGKNKTELMREANLSYSLAKRYLNALIGKGLLEIDEKHRFKTTEQGLVFLEKCEACPLFKWIHEK
jgi:predicted transcriptional regulator